jgi:hypothetical protein
VVVMFTPNFESLGFCKLSLDLPQPNSPVRQVYRYSGSGPARMEGHTDLFRL